jgi:alpha-glucosidase (family GH31 glycosyl hydrolase)
VWSCPSEATDRTIEFGSHLAGEQHFYGMGQGGSFDRLATGRRLWNCHVNHANGSDIAIPLLVSTAGYGLFFDNSSLARLEAGDSDSTTWLDYACEEGSLDVYFLAGEGMRGALEAAGELLGRAPMPPRWSLGYLQSTRHFESADELSRLPATFRGKRLPCDAIFLLSSYGEAMGWNEGVGSLDWDRNLVPDSKGLLAELRAAGVSRDHARISGAATRIAALCRRPKREDSCWTSRIRTRRTKTARPPPI